MLFHSLVALSLLWHASAAPQSRPTVTLASGGVIGTTTTLPSATVSVNKFLGIPFAASPPKRFSPPTQPKAWSSPIDASSFKPACVQQFEYPEASRNKTIAIFNNPGFAPPQESEDCLYVNVFAPATAAPYGGRAVMFWIYGGGLQFGASQLAFYDGSSFATNQDVVVVTFNYRTNVFGFSNSPEIPVGQQNSGFLDQRQALEWVQCNIAKFGGDPKKVTIFGESAGGYSVKQLIALPPKPLPYRAAILESQATSSADGLAAYNQLVTLTNCAAATSKLDCLRKVPAATLKDLIERNELNFAPAADNVTNSRTLRQDIPAGKAAKVPILIGTNEDEGRVFTYIAGLSVQNSPSPQAYLNATFPGQTALQNAILAAYPSSILSVPYFFISAVLTDSTFLCTTADLSNTLVGAGYSVWRYFYEGVFPNLSVFPDAGAYHSSEIPEVFGNYPQVNATSAQKHLSKYMQTAWANFAKNPSSGPGWNKLGTNNGVDLGALGRNGSGGEETINRASVDAVCAAYAPLIASQPL